MKNKLHYLITMALALGAHTLMAEINPTNELETTHWQLVQYLNEGGVADDGVLDSNVIDLQLSGGKFNGHAGCNRYFGSYSVNGEKLSIAEQIATTMKSCAPKIMGLEQTYLALLVQASGYHIDDKTLVVLNQSQQPLLKFSVLQPAELENTQWQAAGINNRRGGVVSSTSTELTTARFLDGKLTGNAGCNQYSAGYTREKERITIGPVMTTRMHCAEPDSIMQQEQEFLQAITGTRIITLDTQTLELRDEEGALQARFTIKPVTQEAQQKE